MAKLGTICVFDSGMAQSLAHRLAREFERVLYYFRSADFAVDAATLKIGDGYDDIERIIDWEDYEDEIDVFCFAYVYSGPLQDKLRREGKAVWGASALGEKMELDRWQMIQLMRHVGLPVPPSERVIGITALREFLQENDNQIVKVSYVRGLTETFPSKNYRLVKNKLIALERDLESMAEDQEFVVQQKIEMGPGGEIGEDGYNIHGQFPKLAQWGLERKDEAYVAEIVPRGTLPEGVRFIGDKLAGPMKKFGYAGFFNTEGIMGKDGKAYLIDVTTRFPSPAGECYMELVGNLGEIIDGGSRGELVQIKPAARYACQVTLRSDFVMKNWLDVEIPDAVRPWIKLVTSCKKGGVESIVPQEEYDDIIGCAVGIGATLQEAKAKCLEHAGQVEGFQVKFEEGELDKAVDEFKKAKASK